MGNFGFGKKALALLAIGAAVSPVFAEEKAARELSAWEFVDENDVIGNWGDRYYTNGMRLAYVSPDTLGADSATTLRWFAGVAQEIYAPKDRYSVNPPAWDRPYAAWLYATGGVAWADDSTLDLLMVNAGVVGPSALGEQTQRNYHHTVGVKLLRGWDSQLHDEPGLDLLALRVWRIRVAGDGGEGWGAELLPRVGAEGGTVRVRGFAGVQFRVGQNLPGDFGELRMRDGVSGAAPVRFKRESLWWWMFTLPDSWYLFVDAQGEARAWDMTLDGNVWHDSRSVERTPFVGVFSGGIAAHWGGVRVAFTQMVITREFKSQGEVPFTSGALTVSVSH